MSPFLICTFAGLFGLLLIALPGLLHSGHGGHEAHLGHGPAHGPSLPAHHGGHAPHLPHAPAPPALGADASAAHADGADAHAAAENGLLRLLQPRVFFGLLALYGAFGYGLTEAGWLSPKLAAVAALAPALLLERFALAPMWTALRRFEGRPASPLTALTLADAVAVSRFHGGRGIVQVERDGRAVQMSARLIESQADAPVRVGDRLRVEEVDAARERVTVSVK